MIAITVGKTGFARLHMADTHLAFSHGHIGKAFNTFVTTITAVIHIGGIQFDAVGLRIRAAIGITCLTNIRTCAGIAECRRIGLGRTWRVARCAVINTSALQNFAAIDLIAVTITVIVRTCRTIFKVHIAKRQAAAVTKRLASQTG